MDMQTKEETFPLFEKRARATLRRMRWFPVYRTWIPIMDSWSDEKILQLLNKHTPEEVKVLFNQNTAPTFTQLLELPWAHTSNFGTYAKLVFRGKEEDADKEAHWVYVGSATNMAGGLKARRKNHENPSKQEINHYYADIVHGEIKRNQKFITLLNTRYGWNPSKDDLMESKAISIIAEGIFAIMLGAYRRVSNPTLHDACVYGKPSQVFTWYGACLRFCLLEAHREIVSFEPLTSQKQRSKGDEIKRWASQKRWFSAYDVDKEPKPEQDLTADDDLNEEAQIEASSSKNAEEELDDDGSIEEEMADEKVVDEEGGDEEVVGEGLVDEEQVDGDNQPTEEDPPIELDKAAAKRQRLAENSRRWRAAHPGHAKAKRAAMTPEELAAKRERARDEMRRLRAANPGREKARIDAMGPEEREAYRAKRAADMRRQRAKQNEANPKPKHVVPEMNRRKNETRQMQRKLAAGPDSRCASKLQQRVTRARNKLEKLKEEGASENEIHAALVKLAVCSVDRLEEALRQNKPKCSWVSPNFWELAKEDGKPRLEILTISYSC